MIIDDWMQKTLRPSDDYRDHPVWMALCHYRIGPEKADLPFARQLARENGWSDRHSARVIEEYRRFCFLAVTADGEMTPSDAVDQAWHLHLTYSRDYWERFCPHILGRALHHGPTAGGGGAQARYFEQYAQTLKHYEQVFGELPPADIWPTGARRMIEDPKARRVHPRDGIVVPRRVVRSLLLAAAAILLIAIAGGVMLS
jgi:hypothetical protein